MSLPKFTAEASLYTTNEHYQLTTECNSFTAKQTVIPQDCYYYGTRYPSGYCCICDRGGKYWCNGNFWQLIAPC